MTATHSKLVVLTTVVLGAMLVVSGCATPKPKPSTLKPSAPTVSRRNASAWLGQYSGTVPCMPANDVSCKARKVHLSLAFDNTYRLITTIIRPRGEPYKLISNGRFVWDASGQVITLASKDGNARLQLAPRKLIRLPSLHDEHKNTYSGYVLHKQ